MNVKRRDFLKGSLAVGAAAVVAPSLLAQKAESPKPDVWMVHGKGNARLMNKCLEIIKEHGGFGKNVRKLALKVNAAWARGPEVGANTHPELVSAFLAGVKGMGIKDICVPEHPCTPGRVSFAKSGILAAVRANGFDMIDLGIGKGHFREVTVPDSVPLKKVQVAKYFLDADAMVNIPVAKHHGATKLSTAMKNWMGAIYDRKYWHRNNLHQCIADFAGFMKPVWTIVDATRIMMDEGPQGPTDKMKYPELLILSRNQVAADVMAVTLYDYNPEDVLCIKLAAKKGLGPCRVEDINVIKVEI